MSGPLARVFQGCVLEQSFTFCQGETNNTRIEQPDINQS